MTFGELKIPHIEIEKFSKSGNSYQTKLFLQFNDIVKNTPYGQSIRQALENDERIQKLLQEHADEKIAFDLDRLACWLIWRVNLVGKDEAESNLNTYLDESTIETTYTLWILGIKINESINLFDNIVIEPIQSMKDSDFKEKFLQNEFQSFPFRTPSPKCALVVKSQSEKRLRQKLDHSSINALQDLALLFNLLSNTSCLQYWSTVEISDQAPYGPFNGSGGSGAIYDVVGDDTKELQSDDFLEVQALYEAFSKLSPKEQSRFNIIINRIRQAKRRSSVEDKILDLVIALEMMLLEENDKEQLGLQFRLRGSLLVSTNDTDKANNFSLFKKLYNYRSSVAHSGTLNESDKTLIKEKFSGYCELAELVCKKLIIHGKQDWNSLVLGIEAI